MNGERAESFRPFAFFLRLPNLTVAANKNAICLLAYKILSGCVHGPLYCPFEVNPLPSNLSSGKQEAEKSLLS